MPEHHHLVDRFGQGGRQQPLVGADRVAPAGLRTRLGETWVAARNREHTGTQNVIQAMDHPRWIARIGNTSRQALANPHRALGLCKQ